MVIYVVTALVFALIFINYFLGYKLYEEPNNDKYYTNVKNYNIIHQRDIMPLPIYVCTISILLGIFIGIYIILGRYLNCNFYVISMTILSLIVLYLIDISRRISITSESLKFEKLFYKTIVIPLDKIDGLYIYSFNKRFLNKSALTTKLVAVAGNTKYKFTLSGIDTRAVLNMMKENFGVSDNKIYIANKH